MDRKYFSIIFFLIALVSLINSTNSAQPNESKLYYGRYLNKVLKRFAYHFEKINIFGNGLPIDDVVLKIDKDSCKNVKNIEGNAFLVNGFVKQIKEIEPIDMNHGIQTSINEGNATVGAEFHINHVHVIYDATVNIGNHTEIGVIEYDFELLNWQITVFSNFVTGKTEVNIKFIGTQTNKVGVRSFPYNFYMQVLACAKFKYLTATEKDSNILKSFRSWDLNYLGQKAVEDVGPIRLCYECN